MIKPKTIGIIFAVIVALGISARCNDSISTRSTVQQPVIEEPQCKTSAGEIWAGVTLYSDSQCTQILGTVYGIGNIPNQGKGIVIDYVNGSRDWKLRSAVTQQTYVMSNDPAGRQRLTRELNYP